MREKGKRSFFSMNESSIMDARILIIFLLILVVLFCIICLCCSIFSDSEEEINQKGKFISFLVSFYNPMFNIFYKFSEHTERRIENIESPPYIVQLEEIKKSISTPIKSPTEPNIYDTDNPPSYEEWLHMSGQISSNI